MMIQIENVSISFHDKMILDGLTLDIRENEKILVTGISGSGKTSLFKAILGFVPLKKGMISIQKNPLNHKNIRDIRSRIFYLSQDVDLRDEIINTLILDICKANGIPDILPETIARLLDLLNLLPDILQKRTGDLSGGERQRIGLLLCFLLDRPVWLLDEPTSALDDVMKKKIARHILDQEKTIIIISHDDIWKTFPDIRTHRIS